ncbi:MAG: hypothetical protein WBY88_08280 [Desulfosarcina sp.]
MFTALISGGLLGTIGSVFTNVFDFFKKRQQDKQELELRRLDIQMMDKEYSHRKSIAAIDMETELTKSADALLAASYAADKATYANKGKLGPVSNLLMVLVDLLRGLVRPVMTGYMVYEVHIMRGTVEGILSSAGIDALTAPVALDIYKSIVDMILFLAAASFTWWFGTRLKARDKGI